MREITDPMEKIIAFALYDAGIIYTNEHESNLDFYLPMYDLHIEVKRMHSPRIAEQMSRAENVIAIQGERAARVFAEIIRGSHLKIKERSE